MNEILKICGIAVLCAVVGLVLGGLCKSEISAALKICGLVIILGVGVSLLASAVEQIGEYADFSGGEEYVGAMLRALAILLLCRICTDICRDCGQTSIASAVESVGKVCLVLVALPLVGEIFDYARQMLESL